MQQGEFNFFCHEPNKADVVSEVLTGLNSNPKFIAPKFFYDQRGSELFEAITELDEYYLTRTEMRLLGKHLPEVAGLLGKNLCVVEYGSGSSMKIRKLLEAVSPEAYVPIDISQAHLVENAQVLFRDYLQEPLLPSVGPPAVIDLESPRGRVQSTALLSFLPHRQ